MSKGNVVNRLKPQQMRKTPFLALDIEDNSSGKALIMCLYGDIKVKTTDKKHIIKHYEKTVLGEKKIKEFVLKELNVWDKEKCIIICYNTSYDTGGLDYLGLKMERLYASSKFISGMNPKGMQYFDLANQFPEGFSLEDLMPFVGMKKDKSTGREDNERKSGIVNKAWVRRCKNDAKATYLITARLQEFYGKLGVQMQSTIAATALKLFRINFFPKNQVWARSREKRYINDFERKSFRGGRVEGYYNKKCKIQSFDVNSMYLSVMKESKIPDPNTAIMVNPKEKNNSFDPLPVFIKRLESGKEGIAECLVFVPNMKYPPLPYKSKIEREDKLIFPTGYLRGFWSFAELRLAMEVGCRIKRIEKYVYYKHSYNYFGEFANWVWSERQKHPKDKEPFINLMIKLIGNSLYGKFGQSNTIGSELIKLIDFPDWRKKEGNEERLKTASYETSDGWVKNPSSEMMKALHGWVKMPSIGFEDASHTFPVISAYITSLARIKLYKEMIKHETVYCDTDSIKFVGDKKELKDSAELGGFGFEYSADFEFYAPKFYDLTNRIDSRGHKLRDVRVSKGLPKRAVIIEDNDEFRKGVFEKPNCFKESKQRHLKVNVWEEKEKVLVKKDCKRIWLEDGSSLPLRVDDRIIKRRATGDRPVVDGLVKEGSMRCEIC